MQHETGAADAKFDVARRLSAAEDDDSDLLDDHADEETGDTPGDEIPKTDKPSQRDLLIECAKTAALWHDPDDTGYATFSAGDHQENHRIRSKTFRSWLGHSYYKRHDGAPGSQAVEDALRAKLSHPSPTAFSGTGMKVDVEKREITAIFIIDFENTHFVVVAGDILDFFTGDTVHQVGDLKDAIDHIVGLKIGAQYFLIEICFRRQ